jgi:glycosyltransferase involved in cell wall biosynthesis
MAKHRNSALPIRILHVVGRMRPGGVQALLMNIYRHIDRSRVQFDFAVRTHQSDYYDEEIKALGGRLFHLPWSAGNPLSLIAYTLALKAILQNNGPFAALHSHGLYSGHSLPIGKNANIPLRLAHSHSAALDKSSILHNIWSQIMRRRILVSATHLLACSSTSAKWLYGPHCQQDARFSILPNAIDLEPYEIVEQEHYHWREKIRLTTDSPLIGHIGRFDRVKNHTFLLDIFSAALEFFPNAKLILIGEGVLKKQIEQEAEAKGIARAVYFLGVRSDIPQILAALDFFILPSLHEGLGIVLVEAQAAGVPCLASDTVPPEVDLGLGLVQVMSLNADAQAWARALKVKSPHHIPDWQKRKATLQKAGYDIHSSVEFLEKLYLSIREP